MKPFVANSQLLWRFIGKLKNFIDSLYDYKYSGVNDEERSGEEEAAIAIETYQSKLVSHTAANQSKLVSCIDSSSEKEDNLHVDVNFDEPIDLAINWFSVFKIEFHRSFWLTRDM